MSAACLDTDDILHFSVALSPVIKFDECCFKAMTGKTILNWKQSEKEINKSNYQNTFSVRLLEHTNSKVRGCLLLINPSDLPQGLSTVNFQ